MENLILWGIIALAVAISSVLAKSRISSLKKSYEKLNAALGETVNLYSSYSRNTGNKTYKIKGSYKGFKLLINNYFDASSTTKSKTYISLSKHVPNFNPILFLVPAKNRENSSYGGTEYIEPYGQEDFNKHFAVAGSDSAYTQLLFAEEELIQRIKNTALLQKGFLSLDMGEMKFTLARNLKAPDIPDI